MNIIDTIIGDLGEKKLTMQMKNAPKRYQQNMPKHIKKLGTTFLAPQVYSQ